MIITVELQNTSAGVAIPGLSLFQQWVDKALTLADVELPEQISEVCIRVVSKEESAELNQNFRQKNGPTNGLSFPYEFDPMEQDASLGDIAICAELIVSEAKEQNREIEAYWAHLVVHGILHLVGYDHIKDNEAETMEKLESEIIMQLGYPDPYMEKK